MGSDYFGYAVSISGDIVVVGAQQYSDNRLNLGSAYVFSRNQGGTNNWGQVKKLLASDGAGRYVLIFQVLGLSDKVGMRIGDSPVGPFSEIQEIWRTPEADEGLFCYNAKAHPNLSKPGELLISYNTITLDFWNDIQQNAHIYRPRFIRLKMK